MKNKKKVKQIYLSGLSDGDNNYYVSVSRKSKRMKKSIKRKYHVSNTSVAVDMLSRMANKGIMETHMNLSVYPTFIFTAKEQ